MKLLKLTLLIFLLNSCVAKKSKNENYIFFELVNTTVKDSSTLKVKIKNETLKNYYMLLDTLQLSKKESFFNRTNSLNKIGTLVSDVYGKNIDIEIVDYSCYEKDDNFRSLNTSNILKIKSGEILTFNLPFRMKTTINNKCWYGYIESEIEKQTKYYVSIKYWSLNDYEKSIVPLSVQDSLKKDGYMLYDKEIISNYVPLIIK